MSQPPDLAKLAQRYVALWQDYVAATAADPELAEMLTRLLAGMSAGAAQWLRQWPGAPHAGTAEGAGEPSGAAPLRPAQRHHEQAGAGSQSEAPTASPRAAPP